MFNLSNYSILITRTLFGIDQSNGTFMLFYSDSLKKYLVTLSDGGNWVYFFRLCLLLCF